jgi:hypothetical protein
MAIKISGTTVIDDSKNIVNANDMIVGVVTMTGSTGDIETPGTITVGGLDFPGVISNINPTNGATNVGIDTNITLSFYFTPPTLGIGTIELREGSVSGTLIESFNVSTSSSVTTVGNSVVINPTNNLGFITSVYAIVPSTAITGYVGLNTTGADSYSFTTRDVALGDAYEGGFLICQAGGTNWIVSPSSAQVIRTWYSRNDANTRAQQVSGCTGWFVPSAGQLQNPGYLCRTYWDSYDASFYWSNIEANVNVGCYVNFATGGACNGGNGFKSCSLRARSFRCVSY